MKIRAFIACRLSPKAIAELRSSTRPLTERFAQAAVRWVPAQNLHLTLRFIGPMTLKSTERLRAPLAALAEQLQGVHCRFGALLQLPEAHAPRVLALQVEGTESMTRLAASVDALMAEPREHPFRPHVTLARLKRPGRVLRLDLVSALAQLDVSDIDCKFDALGLYRSDASAEGPVYTPIFEARFD